MRTLPLLLLTCFCSLVTNAQTYYNPYQDFTLGGNYPYYSSAQMKSYWGEYQWFFRSDTASHGYIHWIEAADSLSWKIEVLSFPFIPNQSRTEQFTPHTKRILTLPTTFLPFTNKWDWIQDISRVVSGVAPSSINNTINQSITIN